MDWYEEGKAKAVRLSTCLAIDRGITCGRKLKRSKCVGHRKGTCKANGHNREVCGKHGAAIFNRMNGGK
jgi:hypothetical protein